MGVNLESQILQRLYQKQPVNGWNRSTRSSRDYAVRIHTLGRFSVQIHHQGLTLPQTRHQRPLEMLQALIAFGGREVHAEVLSQALWPDSEGDSAQNAFDVTLHRLRRLFAIDDLFVVRDRRLTLNSDLAWVDAWTFERLANHSEQLLKRAKDPRIAKQLARSSERLLNLYHGAFLEREAVRAWSLTLRERLRSKLLRHILEAGQVWQSAGDWDQAIRLYHKGLEIDSLAEALYQRLIICFRETGRLADAMATFERCRKSLADHFQIPPSQQTLDLYSSLKR